MEKAFFIQANDRQYIGALLSKYSIERFVGNTIPVHILHVNTMDRFRKFQGTKMRHGKDTRVYDLDDAQSFTLTRFLPPEKMRYQGRAIVIDPDVFAVSNPSSLFDLDLNGNAIACCKKPGTLAKWDTSVMLLENSLLKSWDIDSFLKKLKSEELNYTVLMRKLLGEVRVKELNREWNTLDHLEKNSYFIHYTNQRTQPWKTGTPIDFQEKGQNAMAWYIHKLLPTFIQKKYEEHQNKEAEDFFFSLLRSAVADTAIEKTVVEEQIAKGYIRKDIFEKL